MTDLYITYGLRETLWTNKLVTMLDAEGYTVFWEHAVAPGAGVRSDESIQALNDAKCVIAVWSDTSVDDFWVLSDAERALSEDKLISVVAKSAVIPRSFRRVETLFTQNWDVKSRDDESYTKLLKAIAQYCTPSQASRAQRDQEKLERQQRMKAESERRYQQALEREERAQHKRVSA